MTWNNYNNIWLLGSIVYFVSISTSTRLSYYYVAAISFYFYHFIVVSIVFIVLLLFLLISLILYYLDIITFLSFCHFFHHYFRWAPSNIYMWFFSVTFNDLKQNQWDIFGLRYKKQSWLSRHLVSNSNIKLVLLIISINSAIQPP